MTVSAYATIQHCVGFVMEGLHNLQLIKMNLSSSMKFSWLQGDPASLSVEDEMAPQSQCYIASSPGDRLHSQVSCVSF
jgi:hypothetical protein